MLHLTELASVTNMKYAFMILYWFALLFRAFKEREGMDVAVNFEFELCAGWKVWKFESVLGKKRMFPQGMVSFTRRKKQKSKRKEERNRREKGPNHLLDWVLYPKVKSQANVSSVGTKVRATRYRYMPNNRPRQKSLGVSSDYQFNWFIGGADTCQGDSGGPIWRNIKVT